jgi:hypothetical protein
MLRLIHRAVASAKMRLTVDLSYMIPMNYELLELDHDSYKIDRGVRLVKSRDQE